MKTAFQTTLLLLALGACAAQALRAQPTTARFERLSLEHGLLGNEVNAIVQDRQGFIWLGTSAGLNRYDGYGFTAYTPDPGDANSLVHNYVLALHEDRDGVFWIGTYGGLSRFDPATESFTRFIHDPDDPASLSHDRVAALHEDRAGHLWIGTQRGLNRFDSATETFTRFTHDPKHAASLSHDDVRAVLVDREGVLWAGTYSGGLNRFDSATETFTRFIHDPADPASLRSNLIHILYETPTAPGVLWIGTHADGLHRFDQATETVTAYTHEPNAAWSLSSSDIAALYQDREGLLWVGTYNGGLNRYDPATAAFAHRAHDPGDPTSLSNNHVRAFSADRSGTLWVGTYGGLNRRDATTGSFVHYRHEPGAPHSLSDDEVHAILTDRTGIVWAGTYGGLNRFDPATETFTRFTHDPADPTSLASDDVFALHEDRAGRLWVGTAAGLSRFDARARTFTHVVHDPGDPGSLGHGAVYVLYEDREGLLWVGTEGGLSRLDPTTATVTRYPHDPDDAGSLGHAWVTSIYEDHAGHLWIGTYGGGLNRFDPRDGRVTRFAAQNSGLPDNVVYCLLGDARGRLWLSTNRGLSRFDPASATFKNYDSGDGLQSEEFSRGACHKGPDGRLYFGGINGFNAFLPEDIRDNVHPPQVALTDFRLFNRSVRPGADAALTQPLSITDRIRLSHDQNTIGFAFVALHYKYPEKNQYAYRLDGFDADWVQAGAQRTATYTNLDPGAYVFRVKAANSDGVWNEQGASVGLVIVPPWWQQGWLRLLAVLALSGLVYGAYRARVRRLEGRSRMLAQQVTQRTAEVERQKAALEEKNVQLRAHEAQLELQNALLGEQTARLQHLDAMKSRFFANISHEFRTPLTLILGPLEDALRGGHGPVGDGLQRRLAVMRRNAHRLLRLINQLLDLSRLEAGAMHLHARPGDLIAFVRTIVLSFSSRAEREQITLSLTPSPPDDPAPEEILAVYFDRDKLEKVLYNLLSNAFKFTPAHGKIRVSVSPVEGAEAEIIVKDTGRGIPEDELPYIFDRFHRVEDASAHARTGTGIGLALVRELVELHRGHIAVESDEGFGTTVIVRLPLGKAHLHPEEILEEPPEGVSEEPPPAAVDPTTVEAVAFGEARDVEHALPEEAPTVLIVEDNHDVCAYIRSHLAAHYHVVEAGDGADGLDQARRLRPDLVISDVIMPKMDGYALCRALKADAALNHIPVILLTARASEASKLKGLDAGADDYLFKPFSGDELQARAENLIEVRRQLRRRFSGEVVVRPSGIAATSQDAAFLERVRAVVEAHLGDARLGVDFLAEEVGLSTRQLYRRLRALTNLSPAAYIRLMRLERAAQLLEQRAGNVSEVAYAVGFHDAGYFSKLFRQAFGVPPSAYPTDRP